MDGLVWQWNTPLIIMVAHYITLLYKYKCFIHMYTSTIRVVSPCDMYNMAQQMLYTPSFYY